MFNAIFSYLTSFSTSTYIWVSILLTQLLSKRAKVHKSCVPVIPLHGTIESGPNADISVERVASVAEKAFEMKNAKAVALLINSPGGSPVQSEHIYTILRSKAKEKGIPILVFVEDMAASGGYVLACAGDTIYASPNSIVGSIGVISGGFGFTKAIEKLGIERRVYAEGSNKALLDPFQPIKESDVAIIREAQRDVHDWFINLVKERRPVLDFDKAEDYFTGKIWSGKRAKELGLVDAHGDLYSVIQEKYGKDTKLVMMKKEESVMSSVRKMLGIESFALSFAKGLVSSVYKQSSYSRFN
jgi:signal peptide peptidase SppA